MSLIKAKSLAHKSLRILCLAGAGAAGLSITALAFLYTIQAVGLTLILVLFSIILWRLRNA
jgi:hypothetical protein